MDFTATMIVESERMKGEGVVRKELRKEVALEAISRGFVNFGAFNFTVEAIPDSDSKKVTVTVSAERI